MPGNETVGVPRHELEVSLEGLPWLSIHNRPNNTAGFHQEEEFVLGRGCCQTFLDFEEILGYFLQVGDWGKRLAAAA